MVTNVTSLPALMASTTSQPRPAASGEAEKAPLARGVAVDVDPAHLDYHDDVLAARDDVADARDGIDHAIAVAREARGILHDARDVALRAADPATPDAARAAQDVAFRGALQKFSQIIESAIGQGAPLLAGDALSVHADPDSGAAYDVAGLDLRLQGEASGDATIQLTKNASVADRDGAGAAARAADQSLARLDAGLRRLDVESGRLGQHDRLLGALDASLRANVKTDFDADGARLLALQVRQDLSQATSPIANVKPNAVLSLFRE